MRRTTRKRSTDRQQPSRSRRKKMDERQEYFEKNSPPKRTQAVDSKAVGFAGIIMFLMTNFKKEIGQILVAISKIIGGS